MAEIDNDELEFEALAKCSKALSKLDDESKTRVIRYLLDKFKLINYGGDVLTRTVVSQPELLEKNDTEPIRIDGGVEEILIPSVFELVTKRYAKNEIDILLVLLYKMSNNGKEAIIRSNISIAYKDNNLFTKERSKNLTNNIKSLIKKSFITAPNATSLAITPEGLEQVKLIADGKSTSVVKSSRNKKK